MNEGAIVERGSNANGNYVKFADGTLICPLLGFWDGVILGPTTDSSKIFAFPVTFKNLSYIPLASPYGYASNRYCPPISDSADRTTSTIRIEVFSLDEDTYTLQNSNGRQSGVMIRGISQW